VGDLRFRPKPLLSCYKGYIFSSPLLVPTANKFSSGSWAIAEGFGGNPCSTACKKLRVFIRAHVPGVTSYSKRIARKPPKPNLVEQKQILSLSVLQMTGTSVSCPWKKLKHYWSGRLAREPKCGDYRCTNNLLARSRRETTASDSFENQSRLCEIEVWVMWYPVNQTSWTNRRAYWD